MFIKDYKLKTLFQLMWIFCIFKHIFFSTKCYYYSIIKELKYGEREIF